MKLIDLVARLKDSKQPMLVRLAAEFEEAITEILGESTESKLDEIAHLEELRADLDGLSTWLRDSPRNELRELDAALTEAINNHEFVKQMEDCETIADLAALLEDSEDFQRFGSLLDSTVAAANAVPEIVQMFWLAEPALEQMLSATRSLAEVSGESAVLADLRNAKEFLDFIQELARESYLAEVVEVIRAVDAAKQAQEADSTLLDPQPATT